jgi:hypothetical protein
MVGIKLFVSKEATTRKHFTIRDPESGETEPHFLDLRTELSAGEWNTLESGFVTYLRGDGGIPLDGAEMEARRLDLWITGWSFTTNGGSPIRPDIEALKDLGNEISVVITKIVTEHEKGAKGRKVELVDPTETASESTESPSTDPPEKRGTSSPEPIVLEASPSESPSEISTS